MTLKTLTCDEKDTVSIYKQQAKVMNPEIHHSNAEQERPRREKQDSKRGNDAELLLSAACTRLTHWKLNPQCNCAERKDPGRGGQVAGALLS